jgi:peptidoglycan/LPS O-acetylase OafA/YrhL
MLDARLDGWLGGLSYPIYLFHYQVGIIVIVLFSVLGVELVRPSLTLMIASIPFIFVLSWVVSVALEGPIEIIRSKVKS